MPFKCKTCKKMLPTSMTTCEQCGERDLQSKPTQPYMEMVFIDKDRKVLPPSSHYINGRLDPVYESMEGSRRYHSDATVLMYRDSDNRNNTMLDWSVKFSFEMKSFISDGTKKFPLEVLFKCKRFSDSRKTIEITCEHELERAGNNVNIILGGFKRVGVGIENIMHGLLSEFLNSDEMIIPASVMDIWNKEGYDKVRDVGYAILTRCKQRNGVLIEFDQREKGHLRK